METRQESVEVKVLSDDHLGGLMRSALHSINSIDTADFDQKIKRIRTEVDTHMRKYEFMRALAKNPAAFSKAVETSLQTEAKISEMKHPLWGPERLSEEFQGECPLNFRSFLE